VGGDIVKVLKKQGEEKRSHKGKKEKSGAPELLSALRTRRNKKGVGYEPWATKEEEGGGRYETVTGKGETGTLRIEGGEGLKGGGAKRRSKRSS